jgi:RNA polymerase sigma-70 factor, ECF subfamily
MNTENDEFLGRFIPVQNSLYAFVRAAGYGPTDAEDILQDLACQLWRSYTSYDPARPFVAWAIGTARNLIRTRRRYEHVRRNMLVDTEVCESVADAVAETVEEHGAALDAEREHLEGCLQELPERSREVIRWKYVERLALDEIARRIGKSYGAANVWLCRVRMALMDCIRLKATKGAI